jgi:hypothetical protein
MHDLLGFARVLEFEEIMALVRGDESAPRRSIPQAASAPAPRSRSKNIADDITDEEEDLLPF